VDCQKATRPAIRLSYVVPGATWHPEYDLRFVPQGKAKVGKGTAELTVSAVVQQATGEDWQDVRIALSTAKPKLGSEAPVPMPITVNGSEVSDQKVLVQATERREQLARAGGPTEAGPVSSQLEDRGQSFVLSMPHRTTVRSDGRPYWMPVDRVRTSATSLLVTIPKLKPQVFQVMQLSNPAAYPLLPGQVHVHRAGAYIGDLHLDYKAPGEAMEVSLGPDSELRAVRKSLKHIDRSPGFLSSTRHLKRAFQIELKSNARKAVKVQVRENIPVSKIDDVKVELEKDKTTPGFELDAYRGFISWGVELRAGEEKQLDLAYTIHLPEDWKTR
jgi:uncharacterized protein (TIGR02231 family)